MEYETKRACQKKKCVPGYQDNFRKEQKKKKKKRRSKRVTELASV